MQPNLDRGKLRPPASIRQARERLDLLNREIIRIDWQLANPALRPRVAASPAKAMEYIDWRNKAEETLSLFNDERRQLKEWLENAEHPHFREAYELLKKLQREDFEFDPPELALIDKLDKHFKE